MKTYEQMIDFLVEDATIGAKRIRYYEWVGYLVIAETYGVTVDQVHVDVTRGLNQYHTQLKDVRRAQQRIDHERRRAANSARQTLDTV